MSTSVLIPLIITIILFIALVLRSIDWRALAIKWVGNNPARSQHYIEAGDTVHTVQGERILMAGEGQTYLYEDVDKEKYIIDIVKNYPYKYIRGRRIIGQSDGRLIANPLGFFRADQVDTIKEGLTEVSALIEGNLANKAMRSVKSNRIKSWSIMLIALIVIAGAGFWYFQHNQKHEIPVNNANVTQNATTANQTQYYGPQIGKVEPNYGERTIP